MAGRPTRGLIKLQRLLNKNAFLAKDRSLANLKTLLRHTSVVEALLNNPQLLKTERIYLITTNRAGFYEQLCFERARNQQVLVKHIESSG